LVTHQSDTSRWGQFHGKNGDVSSLTE
jgi:hypothetical protein